MRNMAPVLTGAALVVGITSGIQAIAPAQGPEAAGPLKLSEHVTVVLQGQPGALSNVGIVVGSKGTLVIDSGLGPRNGAILANVARQLAAGRTTLYVAATHFHPEHMMGESGFPASAIIVARGAHIASRPRSGVESVPRGPVSLLVGGTVTALSPFEERRPTAVVC